MQQITVKRHVQNSFELELTKESLIEILAKYVVPTIPDDASIDFEVPSGGDYSGSEVDIADGKLIVRWVESSELPKLYAPVNEVRQP